MHCVPPHLPAFYFPAAALSFILHLDKHLSAMIQQHGTATYAILWTIVFCETGLVLTPFLPGDSLLFAAGAFAGALSF
jgi:membrane-associated protein